MRRFEIAGRLRSSHEPSGVDLEHKLKMLLMFGTALATIGVTGCGDNDTKQERSAEWLAAYRACVEAEKIKANPPPLFGANDPWLSVAGCYDRNPSAVVLANCAELIAQKKKRGQEAEAEAERKAPEFCETSLFLQRIK